jgi:hypothetical protein
MDTVSPDRNFWIVVMERVWRQALVKAESSFESQASFYDLLKMMQVVVSGYRIQDA